MWSPVNLLRLTTLFMQYIHSISTKEHRQIGTMADSKQMMARTWDRPRVPPGLSSDPSGGHARAGGHRQERAVRNGRGRRSRSSRRPCRTRSRAGLRGAPRSGAPPRPVHKRSRLRTASRRSRGNSREPGRKLCWPFHVFYGRCPTTSDRCSSTLRETIRESLFSLAQRSAPLNQVRTYWPFGATNWRGDSQ